MPASKKNGLVLTVGGCSVCGCPINVSLPAAGACFAPPAKDVRTLEPICSECELAQMARLRRNAKARRRYAAKKEQARIEAASFQRLVRTLDEVWNHA